LTYGIENLITSFPSSSKPQIFCDTGKIAIILHSQNYHQPSLNHVAGCHSNRSAFQLNSKMEFQSVSILAQGLDNGTSKKVPGALGGNWFTSLPILPEQFSSAQWFL